MEIKDINEMYKVLPKDKAIQAPSHYVDGRKYEPRKVISDWDLDFNLGNVIKYISRAGRKDDKVEDLYKAMQYLIFEIEECLYKD